MTKITVYSKPFCGGCDLTKKWLEDHNVPYEAIDVTDHPTAIFTITSHGHQSLPVVSVNGFDKSWTGHNENRLEELLEAKP